MSQWKFNLTLLPTQRSLFAAIESGEIHEKVLHYFATDCAKRSILAEYQDGSQPSWYTQLLKMAWNVLLGKQQWLQDEQYEETLQKLRDTMLDLKYLSSHADQQPGRFDLLTRSSRMDLSPTEQEQHFYIRTYPVLAAVSHAANLENGMYTATQTALDAIRVKSLDHPSLARDNEIEWQCHRLNWWTEFTEQTHRFWLAYEEANPLPPPPEAELFYGHSSALAVAFEHSRV